MGIQASISLDLNAIDQFLTEFKSKAVVNAARKSMNRSISSVRTRINKDLRKERKLKAGVINRRYLNVKKAKGRFLADLEASVGVARDPVSLIHFVVGQKEPRNQKGIAVGKRKPLTVEVVPGRRIKLRSAFIAKGRGGKNQVFRRRSKERYPIMKQSTAGLSVIAQRDKFRLPIEKFAREKWQSEFARTFQFELDKLIAKRGK